MKSVNAAGVVVLVADTNRIPFDLEGLILELGDEFLHVLHQFLVAYTVAVLLHGELQRISGIR